MRPDAPLLHEKEIAAYGNIYVDIHGEVGSTAEGFAAADIVHEGVYSTSRVQHVHLETHGSIAWTSPDGRVHVRTSSQAPFIAQQKLCHIFGLRTRDVHVFTERVGGGFGGKQEMLTEDLCVLATLKTGRPVKWEFTREEQFIGATTRHQMTADVTLGARSRRHAHRNRGQARLQHRRLWRPRRRDLGSGARRPACGLSLPEQEGRRLRRLHQPRAGRRFPWLRLLADHLRHRMRDRRSGEKARARSVRDAPPQYDPPR